eukprot:4490496-Prymnesium_polylepis.1
MVDASQRLERVAQPPRRARNAPEILAALEGREERHADGVAVVNAVDSAPRRSRPLSRRVGVLVEAHRARRDGHVDAKSGVGDERIGAQVGGLLEAQHVAAQEVPPRSMPADEGARVCDVEMYSRQKVILRSISRVSRTLAGTEVLRAALFMRAPRAGKSTPHQSRSHLTPEIRRSVGGLAPKNLLRCTPVTEVASGYSVMTE